MAIYVGDNKAILLKGDRNVAELYKGGTKLFGFSDPVSGEMLNINDAHPVEHKMKCRVRSKNLLPYPHYDTTFTSGDFTATDNGDGSWTLSGTPTNTKFVDFRSSSKTTVLKAGTYTFSFTDTNTKGVRGYVFTYKDGVQNYIVNNALTYKTFTLSEDMPVGCFVSVEASFDGTEKIIYPQIEKGSDVTDYTSYVEDLSAVNVTRYGIDETDNLQTYTPTLDGTVEGITSLSPAMTLMTDTKGVVIECEYVKN